MGIISVILPQNHVSLVRKRKLKQNLMAQEYLDCDPDSQTFRCVWPGYKCNTDRLICGKECTENGDCERGEYCDPWMRVCVQGKIKILIFFLTIMSLVHIKSEVIIKPCFFCTRGLQGKMSNLCKTWLPLSLNDLSV